MPFSTKIDVSVSINNSIFFVFFKAACYADPGTARKRAGSKSYISRHTFQKFLNTSSNNTVLL